MLFAIMLVALVMARRCREAVRRARHWCSQPALRRSRWGARFGAAGAQARHALVPNFRRILAWTSMAAVLWIAGALRRRQLRLGLWFAARDLRIRGADVRLRVPGPAAARRRRDWTIDGGHLAERCQLFVIVALGESVLASGVAFGAGHAHGAGAVPTFLVGLPRQHRDVVDVLRHQQQGRGRTCIEHADDRAASARTFHYTHVITGGRHHRLGRGRRTGHRPWRCTMSSGKYLGALLGGPAIYLFGNALFKRVVYGFTPQSHIGGLLRWR